MHLATSAAALRLNITAISAADNASALECWQLAAPFAVSTQPGTAGSAQLSLGGAASAGLSYSVLPALFDAGVHNAPANQWVVFLSGLAHITLPADSTTGVYVAGGPLGLIFAADTADVSVTGHSTSYPGTTETVALQIPTADGEIPAHAVLHAGPCGPGDHVALLGLTAGGS